MKSRLDRLRLEMERGNESVVLVTEPKNRRYLSGFTGSSGWLVVAQERAWLITDGRYWEQVERQAPEVEVFRYLPGEHKSQSGALAALLKQVGLPDFGPLTVEIDEMPIVLYRALLSMAEENGWSLSDIEGRVKGYRTVKDSSEIEALRRAAEIADFALSAALQNFELGQSEAALKAELDYRVLLGGGEGASFPTIVASGAQGSFPHAGATDKPIRSGELVTIDFGAVWGGYCSDMTRTVWWGELSERDQGLVGQVAQAQELAVQAARPGMTTGELDEVARASLRRVNLAEHFLHSLGHGVGLDIHEAPTLRAGHTEILLAGQVVTIEPGVYLAGETGCRIEDTIVLNAEGPAAVLNRSPKQRVGQLAPPLLEA